MVSLSQSPAAGQLGAHCVPPRLSEEISACWEGGKGSGQGRWQRRLSPYSQLSDPFLSPRVTHMGPPQTQPRLKLSLLGQEQWHARGRSQSQLGHRKAVLSLPALSTGNLSPLALADDPPGPHLHPDLGSSTGTQAHLQLLPPHPPGGSRDAPNLTQPKPNSRSPLKPTLPQSSPPG